MAEPDIERRTIVGWTRQFIENTLSAAAPVEQVLKGCHNAHYEALSMDSVLGEFRGDPRRFLQFLERTWNWRITADDRLSRITVDENKDFCVCPLVKAGIIDSRSICLCSEGFIEHMFSVVLEKPVRATVLRSYLRDGLSCIYEVAVPD